MTQGPVTVDQILKHWEACDGDYQESLTGRVNLRDYAEKLAANAFIIAEMENNRLVGFLASYFNGQCQEVFISNISVVAERNGAGLGKKLMIALEHHVRSSCPHVVRIRLKVQAKNLRARKFYLSLGYLPTHSRSDTELELVKSWH